MPKLPKRKPVARNKRPKKKPVAKKRKKKKQPAGKPTVIPIAPLPVTFPKVDFSLFSLATPPAAKYAVLIGQMYKNSDVMADETAPGCVLDVHVIKAMLKSHFAYGARNIRYFTDEPWLFTNSEVAHPDDTKIGFDEQGFAYTHPRAPSRYLPSTLELRPRDTRCRRTVCF